MSAPVDPTVVRSTVVVPSDAGRAALAGVLARLEARRWADVIVPAVLVITLEWLLGLPLLVCVLLAVAVACALVTVKIWQARRRFARAFPAGQTLTVSAGPQLFVLTRGDADPTVEARWPAFTEATLVRDHLVLRLRGSQAVIVLPAALSDAALVAVVRSGLTGTQPTADDAAHPSSLPDVGHLTAITDPADPADPTEPADPADPARVTTVVVDDATSQRLARDFARESLTRGPTLVLVGLLVVLAVAVQLGSDTVLRITVPAATAGLVVATAASSYLGARRLLRASPAGRITLTFGDGGFVSTSAVGTGRVRYDELVGVTQRGETVLLRWRSGLTSIYPRSLFPAALLDEVRTGAAGAAGASSH
ncbi:MAG: hypothetical protein ABI336_03065 [Humibacillus sp.]